jgi:hypothetical protein
LFLKNNIPYLDLDALSSIKAYSERLTSENERIELIAALDMRHAQLEKAMVGQTATSRTAEIKRLFDMILTPQEGMWPENTTHDQLVDSVLAQICAHQER